MTQKHENFRRLERQAAEVINVVTNSKLKYQKEQEAVDVCTSLEEKKKDSERNGERKGERKGEIKGSVETYKEFQCSLEDTIQRIAEKFSLSLQKSEEEVKKYWK